MNFLTVINRFTRAPALASLHHRNFRLFYFGQLISVIGFWMQNIAQAWVVLDLTNSPFLLGMVTFVQFLPNIILSLFAGAFVDRFSRKSLVIGAQTTFMLLALIFAILSGTSVLQYWHIVIISVLMGVTQAVDVPARQSLLVELVGRKDLTNAIALNSSMFNGARVVGPALGGIVLAKYGATYCFILNSISYLFVILGLLSITEGHKTFNKQKENIFNQIREGMLYIRHTPTVWIPMFLLATVSISAMNFGVLVPVFARTSLDQGPEGFGILVSSQGIGSLLGAILLVVLGKRGYLLWFLWGGATCLGVFQLILGQMNWFWPSAILLFGAGWSMVSLTASVNSLIQLQVPDSLRGRVLSVYSICFLGLSSVGGIVAGTVAKWFGASIAFSVSGILAIVSTLLLGRYWRKKNISFQINL